MEEFRDLDDYYSVSNEGRVKSKRTEKILKPHSDSKNKGYKYITLNYNGRKKSYQVHRLVAKLFIPNPNNYPCVNHKDENPSNNRVDNLEWCTYSYNLSYGSKSSRELHTKRIKNCKNAPKRVIQKDLYNNVIREFSSANEAGRILNIPGSHIIDCCNQKVRRDSKGYLYTTRSAGGYKFSWSDLNKKVQV